MRLGLLLIVALVCPWVACGGRIADGPDASNDFKVAFVGAKDHVFVWRSAVDAATLTGEYGGNPCFTPDGSELAVVQLKGLMPQSSTVVLSTDGGATTIPLPIVAAGPCVRPDMQRVVMGNDTSLDASCLSVYDVPTGTSSVVACNASHALYAPDGKTLVLARATGAEGPDEIVTINDDGTGEKIVVPEMGHLPIRDPAFNHDASQIVFARHVSDTSAASWDIDIVDRATLAVRTVITVGNNNDATSSPQFTPDDQSIVFVSATTVEDDYVIKKVVVATGDVTTLIAHLNEIKSAISGPQFRISVAPD